MLYPSFRVGGFLLILGIGFLVNSLLFERIPPDPTTARLIRPFIRAPLPVDPARLRRPFSSRYSEAETHIVRVTHVSATGEDSHRHRFVALAGPLADLHALASLAQAQSASMLAS